jgi:hypothetical protein
MPFTDLELQRLASFRRAASQVRDASIIDTGQTIEVRVRPGDPGYADLFVRFLNEEPFRSLAASFRLIYMKVSLPTSFLFAIYWHAKVARPCGDASQFSEGNGTIRWMIPATD